MSNVQDHPIDESTGVQPQHFDPEGYVVGHPHRELTVEHETEHGEELPEGRKA